MTTDDTGLLDILAIRDHETGKPIEVRVLTEAELADDGAELFEKKHEQYPPPRYEILIASAPTMEMFLTNYPRFRQGKGGSTQQGGPSGTPTT